MISLEVVTKVRSGKEIEFSHLAEYVKTRGQHGGGSERRGMSFFGFLGRIE
jgi:hypothetical protein